jgi:hypothetical protein
MLIAPGGKVLRCPIGPLNFGVLKDKIFDVLGRFHQ